jgi:primosomal protein N' (replication factor Y)
MAVTTPERRSNPARGRRLRTTAGARVQAAVLPVARVLVDVSLAHLDRPYDYLVDEQDDVVAQPGTRVRVRFAGRLVNGYLLERLAESEHPGRLGFVERVVSPEQVLTSEVADLARAVADRYAGSIADVLRLAVPPRHARTEGAAATEPSADAVEPDEVEPDGVEPDEVELGEGVPDEVRTVAVLPGTVVPGNPANAPVAGPASAVTTTADPESGATSARTGWRRYPAGPAFLNAIRESRPARAVWQALPGEDWPALLAAAAAVAADEGRGALLIVPDARDLTRLDAALATALGDGRHVTLSADLGPAERYRRFLAVSRGETRVVAGTRAAVFAPVADLGLVAIFDDGDDLLIEQRAPYPHAREVLMLRSAARPCALLVGGFARTAEAQLLVESGWARPIVAARADVRAAAPRMEAAGDDYSTGADSAAARARLSPAAFTAARAALENGAPVLVQVPRRGYVPVLACTRCRRRAQCRHCRGPLALSGPGGLLACRWCGVAEAHYRCGACGSAELRAVSLGAGRTAEEIGRAFPGIKVINSSGGKVRSTLPDAPAVVIATPGAEPVAVAGYGAALLLDGPAMLGRPDLRAAEETLRRWMAAATLVRPASAGGRVIIGTDASVPVVQALIRWDPEGHAAAELAARRELGFPPAVAMASIEGDEQSVLTAVDRLVVPPGGEILGPVALDDLQDDDFPAPQRKGRPRKAQSRTGELAKVGAAALPNGTDDDRGGAAEEPEEPQLRALVRTSQVQRKTLSAALHTVAAGRSARKEGGGLRIRVDPLDLF